MKQKLNDELSCIWDGRKKGIFSRKIENFSCHEIFFVFSLQHTHSDTHTYPHAVVTCIIQTTGFLIDVCTDSFILTTPIHTHSQTKHRTCDIFHFLFTLHSSQFSQCKKQQQQRVAIQTEETIQHTHRDTFNSNFLSHWNGRKPNSQSNKINLINLRPKRK